MKKPKIISLVLAIFIITFLILGHKPTVSIDKVYSPDRQYSVYSTFNKGRFYERFIPVMPGDGSTRNNCKVIVFDEIAGQIIESSFCMEGIFYPESHEINFSENYITIFKDHKIMLPRPVVKIQ